MRKKDLKSMTMEEITIAIGNINEPKFRAKQIYDWVHKKNVKSFEDMRNLSNSLKEKLRDSYNLSSLEIVDKIVSKQDETTKYLFAVENDNIIESVLMKYSYGNAVCVSTQAGCKMGCRFCASAIGTNVKNLSTGEMLSQVYDIQIDLGERISSVVLMGSGEPLDNYDNVLDFIKIINSPEGLGIGQRHITLSTCGLIDNIYSLADENLQITLAISLHAPNDEIRNDIMPISRKNNIDELFLACKEYADTTKRRVTFEYAMIKGVNDSISCAYELARRLKNMLCHVNLIPINSVKERDYKKSSETSIKSFYNILIEKGIETTIRRELGSDINAACGQLRKGYVNK